MPVSARQTAANRQRLVEEFFRADLWRGRSPPIEMFASVAQLIKPNPPLWLIEHLHRWLPLFAVAEEKLRPSRADMRAILIEVEQAASLLTRALGNTATVDFLDSGADQPRLAARSLRMSLIDLRDRAAAAYRSSTLVDSQGRTKAGRGRARPSPGISARAYCALLIAETWSYFRGDYPPPRNRYAGEAADIYWRLAGGERQSWGNEKLLSWRHHFQKAVDDQSAEMKAWRKEYERHLCESARLEAA
jgi:hypothetical protein